MLLRSMSAKSIGNRFPLPGCRGISGRGSCRPAELTSPAILHSRSDAQFRGEIRLGLLCAGSSSAKIGRSVGSREKTHMARVGTASPLRRDRGFESPFLQRGSCELSVPLSIPASAAGCTRACRLNRNRLPPRRQPSNRSSTCLPPDAVRLFDSSLPLILRARI